MDDTTLRDLVIAQVDRLSGHAPVEVSVADSVVTLTGEVAAPRLRTLIEQELLQLPGVVDVHNHLRVAPPHGDLREQLLTLLAREGARAGGIRIEVEAGAITLSGQARSWFDRDAAERLAWTLPGVRDVTNRLTLPDGAVNPNGENGEGSLP